MTTGMTNTADNYNHNDSSSPAPTPTTCECGPAGIQRVIAAWAVHGLTMSGLVFACLAAVALVEGQIKLMWLWLGIAMIVDGVDGTCARKACVRQVIPWFDGSVLDNIIDYITWTFLPAVFMYLYLPFGPKWVAMLMAIVATVSSVFCYANDGEKSSDNYFVGFPAAWNIVAVTMYIIQSPAWANVVITLVLAVLTLVPLYFTHPMRVEKNRTSNIIVTVIWIVVTCFMVAVFPNIPMWANIIFWISSAWFLFTGFVRTYQGPAVSAK